ncbi:ubiquitin carboxyl-terminal hydrolase 4/11/15 protein [Dioscorea alata]|uniref:Ubiquitin carboxyl-terminal hydrolase 4/11/15 protein n=1 Tax=Dioscorea alata TaxID=55571 RepID=A0ACB7UZT8_DIOAL|nr:ubiquitin carboxyl-terminal hydrolase 4/11/15 protein [Dioscorea alata]
MDAADADDARTTNQPEDADRVYLVPYGWWREAQEPLPSQQQEEGTAPVGDVARGIPYSASPAPSPYGGPMKLINNIFNSDLIFNLCRNDDLAQDAGEGVSGRTYALIPPDMWAQTIGWHNNSCLTLKSSGNLSYMEEPTVKDNAIENYKKACKIFNVDFEPVHVWDFSGQTNLIFMNEWNRIPQDCPRQPDQEILLELQVSLLLDSVNCRGDSKKDDLSLQQSHITNSSYCGSLVGNGILGNMSSDSYTNGGLKGVGNLGLTGLENLGNTCFMNSAIQCLAHTPKLVDYFLGDYMREINHHNPLGMDGEIALAFGDLLRKLWSPDRTPVSPRFFKAKLARFAPQFSGFNQHDSQEFLAFLLDGLHEDLNRVKCKPYFEAKDACGRPDEEVADEYWKNHLARNDSIIVDICQGQYRSTLVCPVCNKVSVTFDPFMYLSLPLPSTTMRSMTVTVFSTDGSLRPTSYTVNVPKHGKSKDLIQALSNVCSLKDDESLLVAEVYSNCILRYLEDPSDSLSLIRDGDRLAAYRLSKDLEKLPLVVFMHQRMEEQGIHNKMLGQWKAFGVPLIARIPTTASGTTICSLFFKLLNPFVLPKDNEDGNLCDGASETDLSSNISDCEATINASLTGKLVEDALQFHVTDVKGQTTHAKIELNEPVSLAGYQKQLHVLVSWQDTALSNYDVCLLSSLPEIYKCSLFSKRPQDSASLYACLEAFLREEPLGPEDMWYCPSCKKHQQASKKLDLWRLPEVLVIHLKRFSYSRFMKNKLETFVDFPIHNLDLSNYIAHKSDQAYPYSLYAVSNHYGNMGGGHYTAYVYHEGQDCWYDFDDRHVASMTEDSIRTSAAYVLFYRRVQTKNLDKQVIS